MLRQQSKAPLPKHGRTWSITTSASRKSPDSKLWTLYLPSALQFPRKFTDILNVAAEPTLSGARLPGKDVAKIPRRSECSGVAHQAFYVAA